MAPIFFKSRDLFTLQRFGRLLVLDVMDVEVTYFKLNVSKMLLNVYGLSRGGRIAVDKAINIKCIVDHQPFLADFSQTATYLRTATFKFMDATLKIHNLKPLIGDYIRWKDLFWLIVKVESSQYIGNRLEVLWSKLCLATVVSDSKVKQLINFKPQMRSDGYFLERY